MKKRIVALLLVVLMAASLLPVSALATGQAGKGTEPTGRAVTYDSSEWAALTAGTAVNGTYMYYLPEDGSTFDGDSAKFSADVPKITDAGTYTIYWMVKGEDTYEDIAPAASQKVTTTVAKADPTITYSGATSLIYNGKAQELIDDSAIVSNPAGATIYYSLDGSSYTTTIPTATDVGTYTVYYKTLAETNFNANTAASTEIKIEQVGNGWETAPVAFTDLEYTGEAQALISAGVSDYGTVQYSVNGGTWSSTIPTATDAGSYVIKAKVEAGTNYKGISEYDVGTAVITPCQITVNAPTGKTGLVAGTEQTLLSSAATVNDPASTSTATIYYSLDNSTWKTKLSDIKSTGSETVYYYAEAETANFTDSEVGSITVNMTSSSASDWDGWNYSITDGVLKIWFDGTDGVMPEGSDVPWEDDISKVTSVVVDGTVQSVCSHAFTGCTKLTTVDFASSVTSIGEYAFTKCTSLNKVTIHGAVTSLVNVFANCKSVSVGPTDSSCNVVIENWTGDLADNFFEGCDSISSVKFPTGITKIGANAFKDCTGLASVTIPSTVTFIGDSAFENCTKLTTITIPQSVVDLGTRAFAGCTALTTARINGNNTSGLATIPESCFQGDTALETVYIPKNITCVDTKAFYGCTALAEAHYVEGWTYTINSGNDPLIAALDVSSGAEDFVTRLYNVCLDRDPDTTGLAQWTAAIKAGTKTPAEVAYSFIFSTEYKNKNACNECFVETLYNAVLNRDPDDTGLAAHLDALENGMTRETAFYNMVCGSGTASEEFQELCTAYGLTAGTVSIPAGSNTKAIGVCAICKEENDTDARKFVTRLYEELLGRTPDTTGLNNWTHALDYGAQTASQVVYNFMFGTAKAEYQARNLCNDCYVEAMYAVFLNREPDAAGLKNWVNQLDTNTLTREAVFNGFLMSTEFTNDCTNWGIKQGTKITVPAGHSADENTGACTVCDEYTYGSTQAFVRDLIVNAWQEAYTGNEANFNDTYYNTTYILKYSQALNAGTMKASAVVSAIYSDDRASGLSDDDFVIALYKGVLGRDRKTLEELIPGYAKLLANDSKTRAEVIASFTGSTEFKNRCTNSLGILS